MILNPFESDAFNMTSLTSAINLLPNMYGRTEELKLFPQKSVRARSICVEERNGVLSLLPTQVPGAPATIGSSEKRKVRSFEIPHIPHDDVVLPEEVQGIRAFGSETEMQAMAGIVADHLQAMRNRHAITLEHLRMGALKGYVLDADGSTLVDLYSALEKRIKLKLIRDRIKIARADKKNLQALLNCRFGGILVRDLGAMKQTPVGASVAGQVFPGAFIATLKKGNKPGMYRRKGKERFPVRSVRVPIDEAIKILEELLEGEAGAFFKKRFEHEIKRITGALV